MCMCLRESKIRRYEMLHESQTVELEIGDSVTLCSSGRQLTVVAVSNGSVKAVWIPDHGDKYGQIELPRVCFRKTGV